MLRVAGPKSGDQAAVFFSLAALASKKSPDSRLIAVNRLYHLFNSAVIGAIFGWLFGSRVLSWRSGLGYGILYGVGWWILGGLILMPVLLGMPAFAPLMMPMMQPVAWGSLGGHIVYGAVTGVVFNWLYKPGFVQAEKEIRQKAGVP